MYFFLDYQLYVSDYVSLKALLDRVAVSWFLSSYSFPFIEEDVGSQNMDGKNDGDEEVRGTEGGKTEVKIPLGDGEEVSAFCLTLWLCDW